MKSGMSGLKKNRGIYGLGNGRSTAIGKTRSVYIRNMRRFGRIGDRKLGIRNTLREP
jgi:hypothetical protein